MCAFDFLICLNKFLKCCSGSESTLGFPFECVLCACASFPRAGFDWCHPMGTPHFFSASETALPLSKGSTRGLFLFPFENTASICSLSWWRALLCSYYTCNQQGYTHPAVSWRTCCQLSSQSLHFFGIPLSIWRVLPLFIQFFVHQVLPVWKWCLSGLFCFSLLAKWSPRAIQTCPESESHSSTHLGRYSTYA